MVSIPNINVARLVASTPKPAPSPTPATPYPTTPSGEQKSAFDLLKATFESWGLGSLAGRISQYMTDGLDDNQAYLQLKQTDEYKQRFAGMALRQQKGYRALSEAEYLSKEDQLREQYRKFGLPQGFYDTPDDFAKAIGADLGAEELGQRLSARKAILDDGAATGVLAYAQQQYGLGSGDLLAFFIDPDRATNVLEKIASASQIGAAAQRTGFGAISAAEAERLDSLGVSANQAEQGFSQAAQLQELTQDVGGDQGVSRDDLTKAIFDQNATAQQKVTRKQDERKAAFQGGGQFAQTRAGFAGLGSANT